MVVHRTNALQKMIYASSQSPDWELEGEALASRNGKLELPTPNSQAGAWELAKHIGKL